MPDDLFGESLKRKESQSCTHAHNHHTILYTLIVHNAVFPRILPVGLADPSTTPCNARQAERSVDVARETRSSLIERHINEIVYAFLQKLRQLRVTSVPLADFDIIQSRFSLRTVKKLNSVLGQSRSARFGIPDDTSPSEEAFRVVASENERCHATVNTGNPYEYSTGA